METFENIVGTLNDLVWSTPTYFPFMVAVLLSFGIFITLRLGFVQVRRFKHGILSVMGKYDHPDAVGDVNHFQALTTALSATVGIGNIAGVAIAIHYGGPGALFWMWVTAFFGMAIKYTECTLAVKYRVQNEDGSVSGGPMYYIEKGLGENWKWLAVFFAAMAVICSFLTGNAVQANTVADTLKSTFLIPGWITGLVTASLVGVVIIGGIKRIGKVTASLMPIMAIIYVLGALIILLLNYDHVIPAFGTIFEYAFTPKAGAFGVGSGLFLTTLVWGIKRGLFSNEAGQGSAPIAHGAARTKEPVREGVVALLEPFIDTLVVCTMTGLVIVSTGVWDQKHDLPFTSNALETEIVVDSGNMIMFENGMPTNGSLVRNDHEMGVFYVDEARTETFEGTMEVLAEGGVAITGADGSQIEVLHSSIVENGAPLTAIAFEKGLAPLFGGGKYIVTICVILFGVSTAISWSYYGDRSIQYLAGDKSIIYYKMVYLVMHFIGAVLALETVWAIGDIALGLMTFPNIIALFALSGVVATASKTYFAKMKELESEN
ncbi:MAG: sodium:alanine symporter family protein [Balneolaceae bacterium]|nr:sodium:alanine symporter family protein [Balneolaceae bacterium]MBO6547379.1 sodium:alanine symporter family protein [Balneolaceae bacterium]MBO6647674.1 sodium:alanine symporter family protein [Balneolaceae bacterium]